MFKDIVFTEEILEGVFYGDLHGGLVVFEAFSVSIFNVRKVFNEFSEEYFYMFFKRDGDEPDLYVEGSFVGYEKFVPHVMDVANRIVCREFWKCDVF